MCIKVYVCFFLFDVLILKGEYIFFLICFFIINNFDFRLKYNDVINNFIWVKFVEDNFYKIFCFFSCFFLYFEFFYIENFKC